MTELIVHLQPVDPDIEGFIDQLETFFDDNALPPASMQTFALAFDEVLCNIASYGQARLGIDVRVQLTDDEVRAEVCDDGVAFDPLGVPEPDTSADLDSRAIGGLGIFLVRRLMDEVTYARRDERNCLTFAKRRVPT
jgi:serine/threonine-protein kinase RsbW